MPGPSIHRASKRRGQCPVGACPCIPDQPDATPRTRLDSRLTAERVLGFSAERVVTVSGRPQFTQDSTRIHKRLIERAVTIVPLRDVSGIRDGGAPFKASLLNRCPRLTARH